MKNRQEIGSWEEKTQRKESGTEKKDLERKRKLWVLAGPTKRFWPVEVDGADRKTAAEHVHHLHGQVQTAGRLVEADAQICWTWRMKRQKRRRGTRTHDERRRWGMALSAKSKFWLKTKKMSGKEKSLLVKNDLGRYLRIFKWGAGLPLWNRSWNK